MRLGRFGSLGYSTRSLGVLYGIVLSSISSIVLYSIALYYFFLNHTGGARAEGWVGGARRRWPSAASARWVTRREACGYGVGASLRSYTQSTVCFWWRRRGCRGGLGVGRFSWGEEVGLRLAGYLTRGLRVCVGASPLARCIWLWMVVVVLMVTVDGCCGLLLSRGVILDAQSSGFVVEGLLALGAWAVSLELGPARCYDTW